MNREYGKQVLGLLTFAVLFGMVGVAEGQVLWFGDDWLQISSSADEQMTYLEQARLRLGGPSVGGIEGAIELYDSASNEIFSADADSRIVSLQQALLVRSFDGTANVQMNGDLAFMILGNAGEDGDLLLRNSTGATSINMDGETGTATNYLSGDGFVKGWARIAADGSVLSCYNCEPANTFRFALGTYYVDFSPIAGDISSRPRFAVLDRHGTSQSLVDRIYLDDDDRGDPSRVKVITGAAENHSFTITVF